MVVKVLGAKKMSTMTNGAFLFWMAILLSGKTKNSAKESVNGNNKINITT